MKTLKTGWGIVTASDSEVHIKSKAHLLFIRLLEFNTTMRRLIGVAVGVSLLLIVVNLTRGFTLYRLSEILQFLLPVWLIFIVLTALGIIPMFAINRLMMNRDSREVMFFGEARIPLSSITTVKYDSSRVGDRAAILYSEGDSKKATVIFFIQGMASEKSDFLEFLKQNGVPTEEIDA